MSYNQKRLPRSVLVFGAEAHVGRPLAEYLARQAPEVRLRLAVVKADKAGTLRDQFPEAEIVSADYLDQQSLRAAVDGIEGVFVITPGSMDERIAMGNLVQALKASGSLVHLIRQLGIQPESNVHRIPATILSDGMGLPVQHPIAKKILDDSGLPVTYLNCGATFMDNFLVYGMTEGLRTQRKLIWPERLIPWIDPREVGEVAARLLLSDNHRHIGQFHTLNNGQDLMRFCQVAALMSEVFGEPITYDGSKESFFAAYPHFGAMREGLWEFLQYEQNNEVVWARNDFVERVLGRKPRTLREWLVEHRDKLLSA